LLDLVQSHEAVIQGLNSNLSSVEDDLLKHKDLALSFPESQAMVFELERTVIQVRGELEATSNRLEQLKTDYNDATSKHLMETQRLKLAESQLVAELEALRGLYYTNQANNSSEAVPHNNQEESLLIADLNSTLARHMQEGNQLINEINLVRQCLEDSKSELQLQTEKLVAARSEIETLQYLHTSMVETYESQICELQKGVRTEEEQETDLSKSQIIEIEGYRLQIEKLDIVCQELSLSLETATRKGLEQCEEIIRLSSINREDLLVFCEEQKRIIVDLNTQVDLVTVKHM
jgi:septal ring factor EnvC (AmiA/AmiB activator)